METMMNQRRLIWIALLAGSVVVAALPWILRASQRGFDDFHNVPYLWVSEDFGPRRQFDRFLQRFAHAEMIVLSYEGCTVDDPRLQRVAERLTADSLATGGQSYRSLFPDVSTGYGALRALQQPPLELSRGAALERLQGILVGPDGETSCALITVSSRGVALRSELPKVIREAAAAASGLPPERFILAGGLLEGIEIDAESLRSSQLIIPSAAVSLLLCMLCLRSLRLALPIFALAMLGQGLVLALTDLSDIRMNAILMVLAPLVFTITMSAGIHLANYYREERAARGEAGAMLRGVRIGWLPCWLAIVTTSIGLGSLAVSEVVPVRQFGLLGAAGSLGAFSILFLIFPGAIAVWAPAATAGKTNRRSKQKRARSRRGFLGFSFGSRRPTARAAGTKSKAPSLHSPMLQAVGTIASRHAYALSAIMLVLMTAGMFGIQRLRTSVDVLSLLPSESRVVQDYQWLAQQLGPLVPLEFIVEFPAEDESLTITRLELLARIQQRLSAQPEVGGTLSALNFLPSLPRGSGMGATIRRRVFNREVERNFESLKTAGLVAEDELGQAWRVTVRMRTAGPEDQGDVLARLRQHAQEALGESPPAESQPAAHAAASVNMTGIVPLVHASQSMLLRDLTVSFLTAFLIVGAVMVAATRSLSNGMIAMLPNLFPVVVVFGVLGWSGTAVDIGTMMTASVALGIAVDGTLHFLITFRREQRQLGGDVEAAAQATLQRCGRALGHSMLICGVGLLVFCLSGFLPTQRFALMIFALLVVSFISDVLLFPALLTGPLKRFFRTSAS